MSMHLTIYVGPFVRYTGKPGAIDVYDLTGGRLCDLRGELQGEDGNLRYAGPNIEMPKITRQLRYDRHSGTPVMAGIHNFKLSEMSAFIEQFEKEIAALRREFDEVIVDWGVVPSYA